MKRRFWLGIAVLGICAWSLAREPFASAVSPFNGRFESSSNVSAQNTSAKNIQTQNVRAQQISTSTSKRAVVSLWTTIARGVEMRTFRTPQTANDVAVEIVALRVKANRVRVRGGITRDASAWREADNAIAAINGGYFDPNNVPIGLRISGNKRTRDLHPADWGVFVIDNNGARILHTRDYKALRERGKTHRVLEAIQCGPRLVVNNTFTKLKPQWARRSALGIDKNGQVIVAIADGQLSFAQWQRTWRDNLSCPNALNLDGGGSTQLSLRTRAVSREVSGYWPVPDAIVIR